MQHRMTVRADGYKVLDRVNFIRFTIVTYRNKVVNVNETGTDFAIPGFKIEFANRALGAMPSDTTIPCTPIPLIAVHENLNSVTLSKPRPFGILIREDWPND